MTEVVEAELMSTETSLIMSRADRALAFHHKAESALREWSENVVLCGLELIHLKAELKSEGVAWLQFVENNLSEVSPRHVQRYMQVADAFRQKLGAKAEPAHLTAPQVEKLRKEISSQSQATTWRQLMMDFGIGNTAKTGRGGKQSAAALPEGDGTMEAKAQAATETMTHLVMELRRFFLEEKLHNLCPQEARLAARAALQDICKGIA